jgi:hypothetical protein
MQYTERSDFQRAGQGTFFFCFGQEETLILLSDPVRWSFFAGWSGEGCGETVADSEDQPADIASATVLQIDFDFKVSTSGLTGLDSSTSDLKNPIADCAVLHKTYLGQTAFLPQKSI